MTTPAQPAPVWEEDLLAGDFQSTVLPLLGGDRGTLIAHRGERAEQGLAQNCVVLYTHGWSDYFFHSHLAQYWADHGAAFYAIDLRAYGRNLLGEDPPERPGYITDLQDYDEEIDAALSIIRAEHPRSRLILSGHSTGGLVMALWAHRHPGAAAALVLNSPWLEFQLDSATRRMLTPLLEWRSRRSSESALKIHLPGTYALSVLRTQGALPYDLRLKPLESFPIYPRWLSAVFAGHAMVEKGLSITAPVLVQMSTKTARHTGYSAEQSFAADTVSSDIVLDVDVLARRAPSLGRTVVIDRVPGALHDVFLSGRQVQRSAFAGIDRFITGYL